MAETEKALQAESQATPLSADEWQMVAESLNLIQLKQREFQMKGDEVQGAHDQLDARIFRMLKAKGLNPLEYVMDVQQRAFVKQ